jgi:hypothetical protein
LKFWYFSLNLLLNSETRKGKVVKNWNLFSFVFALALAPVLCSPTASLGAEGPRSDSNQGRKTVNFLFIHHSCGGQLLADLGSDQGSKCIYVSHPNGGGLRTKLEGIGFQVNEASYGSIVGDKTDIRHWNQKFRDQMDRILHTKNQDELLPDGVTNKIVAFKSCYPNNHFVATGQEPGDPDSQELTVANAKAAYRAVLPYFEKQPDVLFVAFTAPPLAHAPVRGFKGFVKRILKGAPKHPDLARQFNTWLSDRENGWLGGNKLSNVVVFDHYDVLTGNGKSNSLVYPTGGGYNSHPSSEGNSAAADSFIPFIQESLKAMAGLGL